MCRLCLFSEFVFPLFFVSMRGVRTRQWRRNDLIFPTSSRHPKIVRTIV
uniref:Uncharacterized protein n=1 Tax=Siphoviridae sp. ctPAi1 TaxID=2826320 RepID=A0A8S5M7V4_9CAUD|nr:MAG TPA: hypothetical protein [Siphoviridae sp. ctPAi1]